MKTHFGFSLATLVLMGAPALAQQTFQQPNQVPAAQQPARQRVLPAAGQQQRVVANKPVIAEQNVDALVAGMLALANDAEATVGSFAAEHAKHKDVQQFAEKMATDHKKMATQLRKWSPQAVLGEEVGKQQSSTGGQRDFDLLQVDKQITERCISSAKKELSDKHGTDFDMAYIGSQCVLHQQMIDKASVLRDYVSPELRSTIDDGISAAKDHLSQVKGLIEKLAKDEKRSDS